MSKQYYSQIGQDQYYIENISKYKKNGIFLDIGANDGITDSNTAALEFHYDWKGICIEANPNLINKLSLNRPNSVIVNCAAWKSEGEIQLEVSDSCFNGIPGNLLSRVAELNNNQQHFVNHFNESKSIVTVQSKTVTSIIENYYNLPLSIDYMSLDVEGAELEVLQGLNFSMIDIKFMTIEHGDRSQDYINNISNYLIEYGYKQHRLNRWDIEFIKQEEI